MEEMKNNVEEVKTEVKVNKKTPFINDFFDTFEMFIFSACAVLILFSVATRICRVDGPSMLNTLHDSEVLLVTDTPSNTICTSEESLASTIIIPLSNVPEIM